MKALEVWKELIDHFNECKKITSYSDEGKREYIGYSKDYFTNEINVDIIEKSLKALEIIKEYFILTSEYGKISCGLKKEIPEEEYDLLKEELE